MRFGDAHLYLNHLKQAFQDSRKSKPKFLARNTESLETRRESLETRRVSEGNHQETQTSLLTRRVTIHLRASPRSGFKTIAPVSCRGRGNESCGMSGIAGTRCLVH